MSFAATPKLERKPCPKCGSREEHIVQTGRDFLYRAVSGDYSVSECERCGLWYLNPQPTSDQLANLYPSDYGPHDVETAVPALSPAFAHYLGTHLDYPARNEVAVRSGLRGRLDELAMCWKACVNLIPRYVPGGSVLEIGAASGARLLALRSLGWTDLHGIELVPEAAARARRHGFDLRCGDVDRTLDQFADQSLDVIVTSMVLEHLENPFAMIERIAAKLRPGGQLMFSTITRDALDARMFGSYWSGFDFPRHFVFLRDADIADMVGKSFETLETAHHAAPQDFERSASWRRHEGRMVDRMLLRPWTPLTKYRAAVALAWLGLTCRVSYRCVKK